MMVQGRSGRAVAAMALMAMPGTAFAQRAGENAVASAEDAFGTNVGNESTGIYSESDTRGFSPTKAGNVRVDGIYMDTIHVLAGRLRESTAIRVGFAAAEYPFHAPTGIVDHRFRPFPEEVGASVAFTRGGYGGWIFEGDFRVPIIDDHLSLTGGVAGSDSRQGDGSDNNGDGLTLRPIIRVAGAEIAPFVTRGGFRNAHSRVLTVVASGPLPELPKPSRYLGQHWAKGRTDNNNAGVTVKAAISDSLSLRGGLFRAEGDRVRNYTEIYRIVGPSVQQPGRFTANHILLADPKQDVDSTSGEVQLAWRLGSGGWQHRFIAGYRTRNRLTETGGSARPDYPGEVLYGDPDPRLQQPFAYNPVNSGRVKQSALMFGYVVRRDGLGSINLGIQKARYRGVARKGDGAITRERDDPWLYNAIVVANLTATISVYAGTEKGLEDNGTAPENAENRNEQLPPTRSTQYEGGVRWRFPAGQLVVNAFQISKPYFSLGAGNRFVRLGQVRHRGIEASLSGHFGERLSLVAGALLMRPRVSTGGRPIGTPEIYTRIDAQYRTDILGDLTPTLAFVYTGNRPLRPDLKVPGYATVDLGLRKHWRLSGVPGVIRATLQNVFDAKTWKVVAANTIYPEERRRLQITVAADF
jgi:iron complex outermembrane receptor protein